ncbi:hypothetical protein [Bradyrhizobium sp. USDA 4454]
MQIPFLKTDKAKKAQRDLDAALGRQQKIKARLEAAERQLADATALPIKLARDGADDRELDAAEDRVRSADQRVATLRTALVEETANAEAAEQQLAELADQALRAQTAAAIEGWIAEIRDLNEQLGPDGFLAKLAAIADQASVICPDAKGVSIFAGSARAELLPAIGLMIDLLDNRVHGVRAGTLPAALPAQPAPFVPAPKPITERIWLIKPIAWSEGSLTRIEDSNRYVDLAPHLAQRAIDRAAAVRLDDPRAGQRVVSWRQWHGFGQPSLDKCVMLDGETLAALQREQAAPAESKVMHSRTAPLFEVIDRGPAYVLQTNPGNPGEAA